MWKLILVLSLVFIGSANSYADHPDSYGPVDLLVELNEAENSAADARSAFDVIAEYVHDGLISWRDGGEAFIQLLQAASNTESVETRTMFQTLVSIYLKSDGHFEDLIHAAVANVNAENQASDATANLKLVDQLLASERGMFAFDLLNELPLIVREVGNTESVEVRKIFRAVVRMAARHRFLLSELRHHVLENIRVENQVSDAATNIELVQNAVLNYGVDAERGLRDMAALVRSFGNTESVEARKSFRTIYMEH